MQLWRTIAVLLTVLVALIVFGSRCSAYASQLQRSNSAMPFTSLDLLNRLALTRRLMRPGRGYIDVDRRAIPWHVIVSGRGYGKRYLDDYALEPEEKGAR